MVSTYIMLVVGLVILIYLIDVGSPENQHCSVAADNSTKILRLVHTVFRHGQRTALATYPKDCYINETYYPYGSGELTNEGKAFLFEAGEWLRHRYDHYLGNLYIPDNVYVQSTDYDRTKMSMGAVLAGLFPPTHTALNWNSRLNWQPIPIYFEPIAKETLLLVPTTCPRYYAALNTAYKPFLAKHEKVFTGITAATGLEFNVTVNNILHVYTNTVAERDYGLKLPKLIKKYFPQPITKIAELTYIYNAYTRELQRITAGPFLKKMINEWTQKRDGTITPSDRKLFLYSAHDLTIVNILTAINVWKVQIPTLGIMAIFELLEQKETGEYGVQIYLRSSSESGAIPLKIPGCDYFCPLDTFIELTKNIIINNVLKECEMEV